MPDLQRRPKRGRVRAANAVRRQTTCGDGAGGEQDDEAAAAAAEEVHVSN